MVSLMHSTVNTKLGKVEERRLLSVLHNPYNPTFRSPFSFPFTLIDQSLSLPKRKRDTTRVSYTDLITCFLCISYRVHHDTGHVTARK